MTTPRDPYRYFRTEARELLDGLRRGVSEFEGSGGDPARIALLLRLAHTLKGAARVVKLVTVSELAHRFEDVLEPARDGAARLAPAQHAELRRLIESIAAGIAAIEQPAPRPDESPAAASATTGAAWAPALLDTVRLQIAEVESVLAEASGTSAELAALRADFRGFERAVHQARRRAAHRRAGESARESLARVQAGAADLAIAVDEARGRLGGRVERLDRDLQRMHEDLGRLRLIPADALWAFLERAVRDAAQTLGRSAVFEYFSRVPRLDAPAFAIVQEALLHLVRNAVAHGIEPEAARRAAGKPPEGRIRVRLAHGRGRLRVECEDDGRGIDTDAVRRAAIAKGWLAPISPPLDMAGAVRVLLRGGVTTAHAATEVAGRGIGLDVVRAGLARLGGELAIRSAAGRGTTIAFDVPVALSAVEALGVENGGTQILLPLEAVQRVLRVESSAVHRASHGEELRVDGQAIPYAALHRLVPSRATGASPSRRHLAVVLVRDAVDVIALGVDRLLGATEAVVRPLPVLADAAPFIAGATLGAGGPPRLLLDPAALGTAVRGAAADPPASALERPPILVVDDSLTTRMLEQSILESAGYTVDVAVSGEDALKRLRERRYGLMLVDVEMPGMDGFTLVERLRAEPAWRDMPAILVTSRDAPADRQRGLAAGARDYVTKGEFDQQRLLRRIEELLA